MSEATPTRQQTLPEEHVKALLAMKETVNSLVEAHKTANERLNGAGQFLMQLYRFDKAQLSDDCTTLTEVR